MTNFVKNLLDQINDRFKNMTDSIVTRYFNHFLQIIFRIDDMSERIDDLEKTVCKLAESYINEPADNNVLDKNNKQISTKSFTDNN